MPLEAIQIIEAAAASAEALAAVIPLLNGTRSALIEIDNKIPGVTLRKLADLHQHGGFAVTPQSEIPSAHADVFGAQTAQVVLPQGRRAPSTTTVWV